MYRMDQHTHSACSPDGEAPFFEMVRAAEDAGLDEIYLTDHFDLLDYTGARHLEFDWAAERAQLARAREDCGGHIRMRLGVELGEATEDFESAARALAAAPDLDFVIGSIHNLGSEWGGGDYFLTDYKNNPALCARHLERYFGLLDALCRHGQFDSLGHILYPLRYMAERDKNEISLARWHDRLREIFRLLTESGRALELNTTRGRALFGQREVFALYRACGGELVTAGSDAHRPDTVGTGIKEAYALLSSLGFRFITRFERRQPVPVKLG